MYGTVLDLDWRIIAVTLFSHSLVNEDYCPIDKISPTHELSAQVIKLFFFYRFCEDICNLFFGINRVDHNSFVVYKLS